MLWAQWFVEMWIVTLCLSRGVPWGINTRNLPTAISHQGRNLEEFLLQQCLNGTSSFVPTLISTTLPCIEEIPFLLEHYWKSRRKALFLYRFANKKHKKRQPKWSPKCVRTTTATARPPSTVWSTWRCLPPIPTLQWWEKLHLQIVCNSMYSYTCAFTALCLHSQSVTYVNLLAAFKLKHRGTEGLCITDWLVAR